MPRVTGYRNLSIWFLLQARARARYRGNTNRAVPNYCHLAGCCRDRGLCDVPSIRADARRKTRGRIVRRSTETISALSRDRSLLARYCAGEHLLRRGLAWLDQVCGAFQDRTAPAMPEQYFPVESVQFGGYWLLLGFLCFLGFALLSFGHYRSPVMIACWQMRQLMQYKYFDAIESTQVPVNPDARAS